MPPVGTQSVDNKVLEPSKPVQNLLPAEELVKNVPPDKLAECMSTVAIEGHMDEELSDSGGEGMYRVRDEFVVKNEDIESLQVCFLIHCSNQTFKHVSSFKVLKKIHLIIYLNYEGTYEIM